MSMDADTGHLSRRERLRRQTTEEIKERAFGLLDSGGTDEVSIAAVSKAMGMSPPALYRYFSSREALLDALVVDAYTDLGTTVASAATTGPAEDAPSRIAAIVHAWRHWALTHPRRYAMLFSDRPSAQDPPEGVTAVNQAMLVLLEALQDLSPPAPGDATPLDESLLRWRHALGASSRITPPALRHGVLTWSRIHGLVSLELAGAFTAMGLDAELLIATEIQALIPTAGNGTAPVRRD
ncbi:TetR/AcrR family transcriptional regulator [Sphaerisporangium rubeum]|uniref:AcrR family transcriptional regulator n=1 Tax=Sphaerisporangium rubeum TaxID=321317 RepID=A0A7X0ICD8_9ACTN|nr:TetR/AcrR family transcriptional regulator [Sphaerisporangium rubeum]MBB6471087.1 AcrR family transcriptional regulator [Sphaerisporangium rubeum]